MSEQIKVYEARTHFSAILARVEAGEEITIARGDTPIARLVPLDTPRTRPLGLMRFHVGDAALTPLDEVDLAAWEDGEVIPGAAAAGSAPATAGEQADHARPTAGPARQQEGQRRA